MPNRIIKESICTSDSIDSLDYFAEVLFYRLIVSCDDFGRYDGRAAIIKNRLFPLKEEKLTISDINAALYQLANADLIVLYTVDNRQYLYLTTWENHQSIRARKSKYPSPEDGVKVDLTGEHLQAIENNCKQMYANENNCKQLQANVPVIQSNRNPIQSYSLCETEKTNASKRKQKKFVPPTLDEVKAYIAEKGYHVDAETFYQFYNVDQWIDSNGNPVKSWKQKLITWESKDKNKDKGTQKKKQYTTAEEYTPQKPKITNTSDVWGLVDKI